MATIIINLYSKLCETIGRTTPPPSEGAPTCKTLGCVRRRSSKGSLTPESATKTYKLSCSFGCSQRGLSSPQTYGLPRNRIVASLHKLGIMSTMKRTSLKNVSSTPKEPHIIRCPNKETMNLTRRKQYSMAKTTHLRSCASSRCRRDASHAKLPGCVHMENQTRKRGAFGNCPNWSALTAFMRPSSSRHLVFPTEALPQ